MNKLKIYPTELKGNIEIVSSKSLSHRYLIAASLSNSTSKVKNILESEDLFATKNILKEFGVKITKEDNITIINSTNKTVPRNNLDCNESGSTLRFFIPYAWLFDEEITFIGEKSLSIRPLDPFDEIAKSFNYKFEKGDTNFPLVVKGPLMPGTYTIDGSISSQFITGLLFTLPLLKDNSKIVIKNGLTSRDYINMTLDVLESSGIKIKESNDTFYIEGNQTYKKIEARVEGDYSQAAFFLVAGVLNGNIKVENLTKDTKQGDYEIVNIIKELGLNIKELSEGYQVKKTDISKDINIDLYNIPDLGPILMVLASLNKGTTVFDNVDRLKIKESDRMQAMYNNLKLMGANITIKNNQAIFNGVNMLKGDVVVSTYNDHRIAMAMSIAALMADAPIIIDDWTVINKSYPTFFDDYKKLGGIFHEVK